MDAVLAIETGGTKILAALETLDGRSLAQSRWSTGTAEQAAADVIAWVTETLPKASTVRAIGVAAFGPVVIDPASPLYGQTQATPKPGWSGANFGRTVADALGARFAVDTDVNAAAWAERVLGVDAGTPSLAYVTVGTGIGAGWSSLRGAPAYAQHPELGHLTVRRAAGDTMASVCPFHTDCAEGLAAGPAVARRLAAGERLPDRPEVAALVAQYLAQVAAAVVLAWSPHRIKWGGGVMSTPGLLDRVRAGMDDLLGDYELGDARRDAGFLGPASVEDAGLRGAMLLARDRLT